MEPEFKDIGEAITEAVKKHRGLFIFEGTIITLLGLAAIALPGYSTLATELVIGWLFLIGGIVQFVRLFRGAPGFILTLLSALVMLATGALLLYNPLAGILTLTLLLASYFFVQGVIQIILGFRFRPIKGSAWFIVSGILALVMGGIILSGWPGTAAWVMGLLVGINLLFSGFSLISLAYSVPKD